MSEPGFRYYLITDRKQCDPRPLTEVVHEACEYGIMAVQLREKDLPDRRLYETACKLRRITRRWNTLFFVNDRADVAVASGADGVHCRESGAGPAAVKKLNSSLTVGASVHSLPAARRAQREGADFLLFGPVYHTPSKAAYGDPQGVASLKTLAEAVRIPVYAVGGITPGRARECIDAGAQGVAGISSIMAADSVRKQIRQWKETLGGL